MDIDQYVRFVMALLLVLAMIFVVMWLLKRVGMAGVAAGGPKSRRRRLSVVEAVALDTRRRLVLVRCDGVEHLLLLGASGDLVVESGIKADDGDFHKELAVAQAAQAAVAQAAPAQTILAERREGEAP